MGEGNQSRRGVALEGAEVLLVGFLDGDEKEAADASLGGTASSCSSCAVMSCCINLMMIPGSGFRACRDGDGDDDDDFIIILVSSSTPKQEAHIY